MGACGAYTRCGFVVAVYCSDIQPRTDGLRLTSSHPFCRSSTLTLVPLGRAEITDADVLGLLRILSDVAVTNRISAVLTGAGGAELGLRIDVDAGGDMVDEEDDLGD